MLSELFIYLSLGAFAGFLAGLLGIGGGLIIVPVLASSFIILGFSSELVMHLALGTSLASILLTSVSSIISHHRHGAVLWPQAISLTPGLLLGGWCGGLLADALSSQLLRPIFASFEFMVGLYLLWDYSFKSHHTLPSRINYTISGSLIGCFSSLVGIGGGTLSVPWLMWNGASIHRAIATSAALGFPIALAGSLSYLVTGWSSTALPAYSAGYIYLPALFGIILSSILFAPLGSRLAHSLNVKPLKRVFAGLLIIMSLYLFSH